MLIILATFCFGQSVESLKRENQILRNQLTGLKNDTASLHSEMRLCTAIDHSRQLQIRGISNEIQIAVIACTGDRSSQTVKIEFVVTHKLSHQEVCVAADKKNIKAYDKVGNEISVKSGDLGINAEGLFTPARCNKVPTDVPVKGLIVLNNLLPSANVIGFISVGFKYRNYDSKNDYVYGTLEIRNLDVAW